MPFDNSPPPRRLMSIWEPEIIVRPRWQVVLIAIAECAVFLAAIAAICFAGLVAWAAGQ